MSKYWPRKGMFGTLLLLALVVAACGGDDPAATPTPGSENPEPTPTATEAADTGGGAETEMFAGKDIRVIIPYAPGGSSSVLVPFFAHNWPEHLPGNPRVTSTHITPAVAGNNYIMGAAPDGTEILYNSSALIPQQYDEGSEFDIAAFKYVGGYTDGASVLFLTDDVPYDDFLEGAGSDFTLRFPITTDPSQVTENDLGVLIAAEAFGVPVQAIPLSAADTGTAELLVAMERGDIHGQIAGAIWYTLPDIRPGWTENGTVKPIAFLGREGKQMEPNSEADVTAPNLTDEILNADIDQRLKDAWNAFVMPGIATGKHFLLPPDTPDDVVQAWRQAFNESMEDPEFLETLEQILGQEPVLIPGEELQEIIETSVDAFAKVRGDYQSLVDELYSKYTQ